MLSVVSGALAELRGRAERVRLLEESLLAARAHRDEGIRLAIVAGASERDAASAGGVAPSYAHRAKRHGRLTAAVLRERRRRVADGRGV